MDTNVISLSDPRLKVISLQALFVLLGVTFWGFNRSLEQIGFILLVCVLLDIVLHYILRKREILFPFSALVTGMSLCILTNFAHGLWFAAIPAFFAISSKYLFTVNGRHVYNPSLFGVVAALVFANGMITPSPAYQWGGSGITAFFIVTAAIMLFAFKIKRTPLIISFLVFYTIQLTFRAWLTRHHIPPETIFMGVFSSPPFYLFVFFMITDPKTSPNSTKGQILMSLFIVVVDLILHKFQALSTLFYAGFAYFTVRWIWLLLNTPPKNFFLSVKKSLVAYVTITLIGLSGWVVANFNKLGGDQKIDFYLNEVPSSQTHIKGDPSDILMTVDPKLAHIAKWLLSLGDSVAITDVNNDGLPDMFLTQALKSKKDRAQLYLNQGSFQFKLHPIPTLERFRNNPQENGMISNALWFDYDNDSDSDLLLSVGFGNSILLTNLLKETGSLKFEEFSRSDKINEYTTSVTANVLDMNQDGYLDVIIGNAMSRQLVDYKKPTKFNIFNLPEAEYKGDRRMLNVMHQTWYDANNGDSNLLYLNNKGEGFDLLSSEKIGFKGTRWTLDIATGDLNNDGYPDLYFANDFGPDELYINQNGQSFQMVKGPFVGDIGRDTYKGMNATFGDLDNNGYLDTYVSNVHEKLQAEGSLLWINQGDLENLGYRNFIDRAVARNAINENRFGWGAAFGDINLDGKLDILQANGMVDDAYDKTNDKCEDYWYWNAQIGLTGPEIHGYADRWSDLRGQCIFPNEANRVYLNQGKYFVDVAEKVGWTKKGTSRGIALADFDNDGDLDVVVTHPSAEPSIYQNESINKKWIGFNLKGNGKTCNSDAVGTRISINYLKGERKITQYRDVFASNGLASQNENRVLFGLGNDKPQVINVEILWCGLFKDKIELDGVNTYHLIEQSGN